MTYKLIFLTSIFAFAAGQVLPQDYPEPHIVILGATGAGKSSLASVLIGESPTCPNCTFPVCPPGNSCTKNTSIAVGSYVGTGPECTIVDTPGFGDTDGQDSILIDEMMDILKNSLKTTNGFLLAFDGTNSRFTSDLHQMIREMEALFGRTFWDYTILGVTKWSFSQVAQDARNYTCTVTPSLCVTEQSWTEGMNKLLRENFKSLQFDLEAAFIDSFAKQPPTNINDPLQQETFARETTKLWDFVSSKNQFEFKTIEDILRELSDLQLFVDRNMTDMWNAITKNAIDIVELTMALGQNTDDIVLISNQVTEVGNQVTEVGSQVTEVIGEVRALNVTDAAIQAEILSLNEDIQALNDADIAIQADLGSMDQLPLGTILPWTPRPDGTTTGQSVIPQGWMRCDGSVITGGPWDGRRVPNLNGESRFLRGGHELDVLNMEDDQMQDHHHVDNGHTHPYIDTHYDRVDGGEGPKGTDNLVESFNVQFNVHTSSAKVDLGGISDARKGAETRPKNMRVVYIMKVS